jgi:hypothetical protein
MAKPAFQPDSLLLSSGINDAGSLAVQMFSVSGEANGMEDLHQSNNQELTDGVTSMETNCEDTCDETRPRDDSVGTKKRRVEDELSANTNIVADCSLLDTREVKLEDSNTLQNAVLRDFQGATATTANASFSERVIELTLVMFEVIIL